MMHMAGEVKSRIGELTEQRDLLSVVFGGLVEGVVVVDRDGDDRARQRCRASRWSATSCRRRCDARRRRRLREPLSSIERALAGEQADAELALLGREVRASARPLGDPGAIVVLYDVTRMRALEAVRREFLSNAAHELRTPVTSISGYAETLLGGGVDAETSKEFLTTIHRNAQRIADLVSDLARARHARRARHRRRRARADRARAGRRRCGAHREGRHADRADRGRGRRATSRCSARAKASITSCRT